MNLLLDQHLTLIDNVFHWQVDSTTECGRFHEV